MGLHGMRVGIAWLWCANFDRGVFNGKQSKDQPEGDNWEAHDFSVYLRAIPLAGVSITAPPALGERGKK